MAKSAQIQERHYIINIKGEYMLPLILATVPSCVEIALGTAAIVATKKLTEK